MRWYTSIVIISVSIVLAVVLGGDSAAAQQSSACEQRNFGHDSFVCVCNVTYCDSFISVAPGGPGLVTTYTSDRDASRFATGQLQFTKNTLNVGDGIVVTIERDQKFQTLLGFGGSFSDSAGYNIDKLPAKLAKNLINVRCNFFLIGFWDYSFRVHFIWSFQYKSFYLFIENNQCVFSSRTTTEKAD